jgi:hypothetical protein
MENGTHFQSFNEKSLKNIFEQTLSKFSKYILTDRVKLDPVHSSEIPYSSQYSESTFNYLKRLSNKYGEWFYYDGINLVLGPPKDKEIDLTFSQNVSDLNLSLRLMPLNFKKHSNDFRQDKMLDSASSKPANSNLGTFGNNIFDESESVYDFETQFITDTNGTDQATLDNEVKNTEEPARFEHGDAHRQQ